MSHMRLFILMALAAISIPSAYGGEHRVLCEKVTASTHVFEAQFKVRGTYPQSLKSKGYPPAPKTIKAMSNSGRITRVFKGPLTVGTRWKSDWPQHIPVGGQSVRAWERLMKRRTFRRLVFLEKTKEGVRSSAWAEGSAACGSRDTDHRSWCPGYAKYTERVIACLRLNDIQPDASLLNQVVGFCLGRSSVAQRRAYRFLVKSTTHAQWAELRIRSSLNARAHRKIIESTAVQPAAKTQLNWPPSRRNRPELKAYTRGPWIACPVVAFFP